MPAVILQFLLMVSLSNRKTSKLFTDLCTKDTAENRNLLLKVEKGIWAKSISKRERSNFGRGSGADMDFSFVLSFLCLFLIDNLRNSSCIFGNHRKAARFVLGEAGGFGHMKF